MARSSPAARKVGLKRVLAGLTLICLGSLSLVSLGASPATAEHDDGPLVEPTFVAQNNPTCSDLSALLDGADDWTEVKYEGGNWTPSDIGIDIVVDGDEVSFDSPIAIDAVLVKAGSFQSAGGHNLYWYDHPTGSEVDHDNGLVTAEGHGVSHVSFCYDTDLYDLTVNKTVVDGTDEDTEGDVFEFTVDCDGEEFDDEFTLGDGDTGSVADITEGTSCTVSEDNTGWSTTIEGQADADGSTAVVMNSDQTLDFHNSREAGPTPWTLRISKEVAGTDAPADWSFNFEVTCGEGEPTPITLDNDPETEHGEEASIGNIDEGVSCTVEETEDSAAGFVVSHSSDGETFTGGRSADADEENDSVFFRNTRDLIGPIQPPGPPDPPPPPPPSPEVFAYECSAPSAVTASGATLHGDTDDPDVAAATFTLSGGGDIVDLVDTDGTDGWSVAATGLSPATNYTYSVRWALDKASDEPCELATSAAEVEGEVITPPPPRVLGEVFTKNPPKVAPAVLARTGVPTETMVAAAALLILLGAVLLVPTRRRDSLT